MLRPQLPQFITFYVIALQLAGIKAAKAPHIAISFDVKCYTFDRTVVSNFNCSLVPDRYGLPLWNLNFTATKDLSDVDFRFKFLVERGGKYRTTIAMNFDFCREWADLKSHMLLRFMAKETSRVSNLQCPLKKNIRYYLENYNTSAFPVPSYVPELKYKTIADFFINKNRACMVEIQGIIVPATTENIKKSLRQLKSANFP
ncbi:unnamed protein product [Ceratitis capitata]|uniref:(Mediterranean fruit fly) hypothetical protein n=1 Tax=Ceratitis capitata TaxID=7213 RepID=A0A811UXV5_CERCA|nr:unnamed protein product [Ceratitis capitata]